MGQELKCDARWCGRSLSGKAYLETDFVLFRGEERVRVGFSEMVELSADAGVLRVVSSAGGLGLGIGKAAEKWRDKILHPPTRISKLGVKEGMRVRLVGSFEPEFVAELNESKCE